MKKILSLVISLFIVFGLCSCGIDIDDVTPSTSEESVVATVQETEDIPNWENDISKGVRIDLEYAFSEIGERIDAIESIEYVGEKANSLFVRRDYKISLTMDYIHFRWYRLTTEEWNEGEPEREKYPREYLVTIKFWTDDNSTNINQWTASGNGELQDASAGEYSPPIIEETTPSFEIGESSSNPIVISISDLVAEINTDIDVAKDKYNGKWIEITGTVTFISESAGMTGYYLYGERGAEGLNICCWVNDADAVNLYEGQEVTFIGAMREVSIINNTDIGLCTVK